MISCSNRKTEHFSPDGGKDAKSVPSRLNFFYEVTKTI